MDHSCFSFQSAPALVALMSFPHPSWFTKVPVNQDRSDNEPFEDHFSSLNRSLTWANHWFSTSTDRSLISMILHWSLIFHVQSSIDVLISMIFHWFPWFSTSFVYQSCQWTVPRSAWVASADPRCTSPGGRSWRKASWTSFETKKMWGTRDFMGFSGI